MSTSAASQRSLATALKQILNQLGRMLEEEDPRFIFAEGGSMPVALGAWRQAVADQTRPADRDRERRLENEKLEMMGQNAMLQKECSDLRSRNSDLLNQIVKLNEREKDLRQQVLDVQFQRGGVSAENKALDLEVRDLRRRVRELEGGPPLTPAEAAPVSRQVVDRSLAPAPEAPAEEKRPRPKRRPAKKGQGAQKPRSAAAPAARGSASAKRGGAEQRGKKQPAPLPAKAPRPAGKRPARKAAASPARPRAAAPAPGARGQKKPPVAQRAKGSAARKRKS